MMSQRRTAQFGLVAASVVLAGSIVVLVVGSNDGQSSATASVDTRPATPLADNTVTAMPMSIAKH